MSRRSIFGANEPISAIFCPCVLSKVLKFILLQFPRISGLGRSGLGGFLSSETGEGVPPPGWHEEKAGMCFQTRIFDPSFWRGEAGQVETQMDPADPISLWWQRIGKVRAVRQ